MKVTVSHLLSLVCWVSLATLPYWWLVNGYDWRIAAAALFWLVLGTLAALNTVEIRRRRR